MATPLIPALNAEDAALMKKVLDDGHFEYKYAVRLQVILHRANGKTPKEIARFLTYISILSPHIPGAIIQRG